MIENKISIDIKENFPKHKIAVEKLWQKKF
jgi:hypothetical protein